VDVIVRAREFQNYSISTRIEDRLFRPEGSVITRAELSRNLSRRIAMNTEPRRDICPYGYFRLVPYIHQKATDGGMIVQNLPPLTRFGPLTKTITWVTIEDWHEIISRDTNPLNRYEYPDSTGPLHVHNMLAHTYRRFYPNDMFDRGRLLWLAWGMANRFKPVLENELANGMIRNDTRNYDFFMNRPRYPVYYD
jgi:hypothetical protein